MLTEVALICSIAGIVCSIVAVLVMYLTRKSIVDLLDKDKLYFDKNFDVKKKAISTALKLVDELGTKGPALALNPQFNAVARDCYNDLLCVSSSLNLAQEFYSLALTQNADITEEKLLAFKLHCRKDIGLSMRHSKDVKNPKAL